MTTADDLQIHELHGAALRPWLDGVGALRLSVFREFPYLYDGTLEEERQYLRTYLEAPGSLIVLIVNGRGEAVGASTCLPLSEEEPEFQQPFRDAGMDIPKVCYFGESILIPELRGRGLGKEFFKRREAHARHLGMETAAFCAVDRPDGHPLRPAGYRPLDPFWTSQGYTRQPDLRASFVWKETGEAAPSPKTLTFWTKSWRA